MVLGYICNEHGYQRECDVSKEGERICYECGDWMRGLMGHTRGRQAPPEDEPMTQEGDILWAVDVGRHGTVTVTAFGLETALQKAFADDRIDEPTDVREIYPATRRYRR